MTATKILKNQKGEGGPKVLLNSGHLIPLIGLGTYKIVDQTLMDSSVDAALKCGYRFFDTAKLYQNEKQLGNSLEVWKVFFMISEEVPKSLKNIFHDLAIPNGSFKKLFRFRYFL
ncbi:unnamed protein product [Meloidogyne enterolobii]|uniref:Uncharacterized protein n=1 Tax=Meloidogyne enterolobii TaxID=390850 RepID=A0ACB0YXS5_MELEN